jgi:carbamate kinase
MNEIAWMKTRSGKRALLVERILVIENASNVDEIPPESVINDWLFGGSGTIPVTQRQAADGLYKLYFMVDEDLCQRNLTREMAAQFIEQFSDYDYIFIELFNLDRNIQVLSHLMAVATYNLVVVRYKKTLFSALNRVTAEIAEATDIRMGAVLNRCHPALI